MLATALLLAALGAPPIVVTYGPPGADHPLPPSARDAYDRLIMPSGAGAVGARHRKPHPAPPAPAARACEPYCPAGDCCGSPSGCRNADGSCVNCYGACAKPPLPPAPAPRPMPSPPAAWYAIAPAGWGPGWLLWGYPDGKGMIIPATEPPRFLRDPAAAPAAPPAMTSAPAGVTCQGGRCSRAPAAGFRLNPFRGR